MKKIMFLWLALLPISLWAGQLSLNQTDEELLAVLPEKKGPTDEERHAELMKLLNTRQFVLKAHTVYDRYGRMALVTPSTNFVAVNEEVGVMQLAFNNGRLGYNGLGGITLDGRVTKFEVKDRGVGKGAFIKMHFFGGNSATVFAEVDEKGRAWINWSGMRGERVRFKGDIVPLKGSRVFEGRASY